MTPTPKSCALSILLAASVLAGCSSVKLDDKAAVEDRMPTPIAATPVPITGATTAPVQSQVTTVDANGAALTAANNLPRVVYFDFDSYVVKDEFRPVIDAHAKALVGARTLRMAIEGHTDDRGGREYNLALGQKRAEAVVKALTLLGASESQIEPVSFGKERAAVQGSDEAAWAKNRRAELTYRR